MNVELIGGGGAFFTPSTVLEAELAIDVALTPGDPRFWSLLDVTPAPGTRLGSGAFPTSKAGKAAEPPFLVSLFLQYKRPTSLRNSGATEWDRHREAYLRIDLSRRQHQRLRDLERAVAPSAVVRYAAPSFWSLEDLWRAQTGRHVAERSLYASPLALGSHERWTWSPGMGSLAHSTPREFAAETGDTFPETLVQAAVAPGRQEPRQHLSRLAAALTKSGFQEKLAPRAASDVKAGDEPWLADTALFADLAVITQASLRAAASWRLLVCGERASASPT